MKEFETPWTKEYWEVLGKLVGIANKVEILEKTSGCSLDELVGKFESGYKLVNYKYDDFYEDDEE